MMRVEILRGGREGGEGGEGGGGEKQVLKSRVMWVSV